MRILLMGFLLVLSSVSYAQGGEEKMGQLSLRVEVTRKVSHDLMQVVLFAEEQDKNPATLAKKITERLNTTITKAQAIKGKVSIQTGSRISRPIYKAKGQNEIVAWRERAQLMFESTDFTVLSNLVASLGGDLQIESISFAISKNLRLKLEEELSQEAATAFMQRSKTLTNTLGAKKFELLNLDLSNRSYYNPSPLMRVQAGNKSMLSSYVQSDGAASTPQFIVEGGSSEFVFAADGRIVLSF